MPARRSPLTQPGPGPQGGITTAARCAAGSPERGSGCSQQQILMDNLREAASHGTDAGVQSQGLLAPLGRKRLTWKLVG